ncbi:extracellular calcium-sensing receptor-like isoform X2 [Branchiostoma lanceolatum]|uniref:extracellular calcium-sensing receptor-like isoform X2 n=1 Tax=Branchiostoma lanceolatum TaxID=7740 RepID=UPI0034529879
MLQLQICERTFVSATFYLLCYMCLVWRNAVAMEGYLSSPGDIMLGGLFSMHTVLQDPQNNQLATEAQCDNFRYRGFRELSAMRFAIEEINNSTTLLPNVTLGYNIFDDCNHVKKALAASLRFAARNNIATIGFDDDCQCNFANPATLGVVGPTSSDITISVANLLGLFDIPMISYAATSTRLSNKSQFPNFLRTVPSDFEQPKVMAEVVAYFNWTWVGTIAGDNSYGRPGIEQFLTEAENRSICVAFTKYITAEEGIDDALRLIENNPDVKVIVAFIGGSNLAPLMSRVKRQDITWIASEAWSTSSSILKFTNVTRGTLGIQLRRGRIEGFWEYLSRLSPLKEPHNKLLQYMWEEEFNCKYEEDNTTCATPPPEDVSPTPGIHVATQNCSSTLCTRQESLEGSNLLDFNDLELTTAFHSYVAVYAYAHALHNIFNCRPETSPLPNRSCPNVSAITPRELLQFVRNVNFTDSVGETVTFDKNGEPAPQYSILNWQERNGRLEIVQVANVVGRQGLELNHSIRIQWNNGDNDTHTQVPVSTCSQTCEPGFYKGRIQGKPTCCWDCLPCGEGNISTTIDADKCIPCGEREYNSQDRTECLPREVDFLDWTDPMAIVFLSLVGLGTILTILITILFFVKRNTPVVKASSRELLFLLLFGLLLCFVSFIPFIGYPTAATCILRPYPLGLGFAISISVILVKTNRVRVIFEARLPSSLHRKWLGIRIQLLSVFLAVLGMLVVLIVWSLAAPPYPEENLMIQRDKIFLECKAGSWIGWGVMIGYIVVLAMCCFYFAFKARKLPENFNEAKFIVLSMLIFFIVWISIIPAYIGTTGEFVVMTQGIAIYASTFGLLACFFFPKCWVILVTPERNTMAYIRESTTEHSFVTAARVTIRRQTDETQTSAGSKGSSGSLFKKGKKEGSGSGKKSEGIKMEPLGNKNTSNNNRLSPLHISNSPKPFSRERSCSSPTIIITQHQDNTHGVSAEQQTVGRHHPSVHVKNEQTDRSNNVPNQDTLFRPQNPVSKDEAASSQLSNNSTPEVRPCFNFDVDMERQSSLSGSEMQQEEDKTVSKKCPTLSESSEDSLDSNTGLPLLTGYSNELPPSREYNLSDHSSPSVSDTCVQPIEVVCDTSDFVQPSQSVLDTPVQPPPGVSDPSVQPPQSALDTPEQPLYDMSVQSATPKVDRTTIDDPEITFV